MKFTGIVRKIDELGRVVLPKELRETMGITAKDALEIYVRDDEIIFKKYEPFCVFCHGITDIVIFEGKNVCSDCIQSLSSSFSPGL